MNIWQKHSKALFYTVCILFVAVLGLFSVHLKLFYDDTFFVFPAVSKDYWHFGLNYFRDYGLFRPLALAYYFCIYNVYLRFPGVAHLLPLFLQGAVAVMVFKLLERQLAKADSLLFALLIFVSPLSVEGYVWFSANVSILVILLLLMQIYWLVRFPTVAKYFYWTVALQFLSVFLYESTFFLLVIIDLMWLHAFWTRSKSSVLSFLKRKGLFLFLLSTVPFGSYLLSKLILKPNYYNRAKFITVPEMAGNFYQALGQFKRLFDAQIWLADLSNGWGLVVKSSLLTGLLAGGVIGLMVYLYSGQKKQNFTPINKERRAWMIFGVVAFLAVLIPFLWQSDYWPFRLLYLPSILIVMGLALIFSLGREKQAWLSFVRGVLVSLIVVSTLISLSMLDKYRRQFEFDFAIMEQVSRQTKGLGYWHPLRTNLLLTGVPPSAVQKVMYGDYLHSIFANYWSAEAFLDLYMGSISKLAIKTTDGRYVSRYEENYFAALRPQVVMKVTNEGKVCSEIVCLTVLKVLK